ncbi:hypothetical protein KPL71_004732 [Citrus sinensis]|uniref:Uncharacterized protein n=1 Tax=Citrus sinensis TaxID=2711 RepID=A0ACB8N752_CITSI|nr:hypothetical protein KPL71_004732 [Citrus sinensis]
MAAETVASVTQPITEKIVDVLFNATVRQFGYLCKYKHYIEALRTEAKKLTDTRNDLQAEIDAATRNGEAIKDEVQRWPDKVDEIIPTAEKFLEDEVKVNKTCLGGLCVDLKSRYKLSREAEEKILAISALIAAGNFGKDVSRPAPPPAIISLSEGFYNFKSRESTMKDIMEAMKDEKVSIIGICGRGGIGKTTLVKEIQKQAKEKKMFDEVAMAVVSQTPSITKIQDEIAGWLGIKELPDNDELVRASLLCKRIEKQRVLVILDDLWVQIELDRVGIPYGNDGCKFLLTSRSRAACNQMQAHIVDVRTLTEEESWRSAEGKRRGLRCLQNVDSVEKARCRVRSAVSYDEEEGCAKMHDVLDQNNFILWRTQVLTTVKGNGLEGFINGDNKCPEQFLISESDIESVVSTGSSRSINSEFVAWMKTDQLLLSWMMSSIQQNLLSTVIDCTTSKQLWETLTGMFISQSQARIQTLRMQIQTIKKGSMHMADYFAKVKRIADTLALAGKPVELGDLIMHVLIGLDSFDCESLVTAVLARGDKITLDELYSLLLNHEIRIEQKRGKITSDVMHNMTANVAQRNTYSGKNNGGFQKNYGGNFGNGNNSGFGGFNSGASGNSSGNGGGAFNGNNFSDVVCQICYIPGHGAYKCRNRYNSSFVPQKNYGRGNFDSGFRPPGQFGKGRFFNGGGRGPGQFNNNYNSPRGFGFQGGSGFQGNIVHAENSFSTPSAFYSFTPGSSTYAPTENPDNSGQYNASTSSSLPPSNPNVSPELVEDPSWYFDSGATNYITNDLGITLLEGVAKGGLYQVKNIFSQSSQSAIFNSDSFNKPESLFASCAMSHVNKPEVVKASETSFQFVFSAVALQSVPLATSSTSIPDASQIHINQDSSPSLPTESFSPSTHHSPAHTLPLSQSTGHQMITRSKASIFKPKAYLSALLAQPSEPLSTSQALADPMWFKAMQEEFQALQSNKTWELVLPDTPVKIVGNKWVFRIKYNSDGSISRYKARLVAKGFHQTQGVDYTEIFSPVVKASTKAIYGLKQAPRAWFDRFKDAMITQWQFQHSKSDSSLFYKWINGHVILVLVYVDDIILTGSNPQLIQQVIQHMHHTFALKDLGDLNYFLGIEVVKSATGLYLSQAKYIADILAKHDMVYSSPVSTPMFTSQYLTKDSGDIIRNVSQYRSIVGALQYVTLTRPDIAYSVNKLSQFLSNPRTSHWDACKRLLRYLKGTLHLGLHFHMTGALQLHCFTDSDWASDRDDRKSVAGYAVYLEVIWIQSLLQELQIKLSTTPMMWCDNQGAIARAYNPVYHAKTKHVELDIHFIRDKVAAKSIESALTRKVYVYDINSELQSCINLTGISLMFNEIHEVPDGLECPKIQALFLQKNSPLVIPDKFFQRMKDLKVLDMGKISRLSLPPLSFLINLRTLRLDNCFGLGDLSLIGELGRLEILDLSKSHISEIPASFRQLAQLKLLDLTGCYVLELIPQGVISRLCKLEELYMSNSFHHWQFESEEDSRSNAKFIELRALSRLTSLHTEIPKGKILPSDMSFQNLTSFFISIGVSSINSSWAVIELFNRKFKRCSRALWLMQRIAALHSWIKNLLLRSEILALVEINDLEHIFSNLANNGFNELMFLAISGCNEMKCLLNSLERTLRVTLLKLEWLMIVDNRNFVEICHGQLPAGCLSNVKRLDVAHCGSMLKILSSHLVQSFQNLQRLTVESCELLVSVFEIERVDVAKEEIGLFSSLEKLTLIDLPRMTDIWKGDTQFVSLRNLKKVRVQDCNELRQVFPASLGKKAAAEEMVLYRKRRDHIHIHATTSTSSPTRSLGNLVSITIQRCGKLRKLFTTSMVKSLVRLESLEVSSCPTLQEIIMDDEGEVGLQGASTENITFPSLFSIQLWDLDSLACFCSAGSHATTEFLALEALLIIDCPSMKTFGYGDQLTPKLLKGVKLEGGEYRWTGNLNHTIQQYVYNAKKIREKEPMKSGISSETTSSNTEN